MTLTHMSIVVASGQSKQQVFEYINKTGEERVVVEVEKNSKFKGVIVLKQMNLEPIDYHPGYSIFVHSLGVFNVWRGENRIRSAEWQRDKARKLFQLLLLFLRIGFLSILAVVF